MPATDRYIGREIDGYRVIELIGQGGMGVVYRAEDTRLERVVALKILPENAMGDRDAVKRFEREARLLAEVDHPNIARVYRIGTVDGSPYYAMEFINGRSLQAILSEQGRIGGSRAIRLLIQAAQGLEAAAKRGITHRDVKPGNILVTTDDCVKIVDFGIAKALGEDTFLTATGMILGTPHYISPEQARGGKVDARSDMYSLGATFYHVVAGCPPFDAESAITLIEKHINEPVRAIREINANVPERFCNILYAMLSKRPDDRFQDYAQLIVALENVFGPAAHGMRPYTVEREGQAPTPDKPSPAGWVRAKWPYLLIAAILLIILIPLLGPKKKSEEPANTEPRTERGQAIHNGLIMLRDYRKEEKKEVDEEEKKADQEENKTDE